MALYVLKNILATQILHTVFLKEIQQIMEALYLFNYILHTLIQRTVDSLKIKLRKMVVLCNYWNNQIILTLLIVSLKIIWLIMEEHFLLTLILTILTLQTVFLKIIVLKFKVEH